MTPAERLAARYARYNASEKGRARQAKYNASRKGRARDAKYRATPRGLFTKITAAITFNAKGRVQ